MRFMAKEERASPHQGAVPGEEERDRTLGCRGEAENMDRVSPLRSSGAFQKRGDSVTVVARREKLVDCARQVQRLAHDPFRL